MLSYTERLFSVSLLANVQECLLEEQGKLKPYGIYHRILFFLSVRSAHFPIRSHDARTAVCGYN